MCVLLMIFRLLFGGDQHMLSCFMLARETFYGPILQVQVKSFRKEWNILENSPT